MHHRKTPFGACQTDSVCNNNTAMIISVARKKQNILKSEKQEKIIKKIFKAEKAKKKKQQKKNPKFKK